MTLKHTGSVLGVAFSPDGRWLAVDVTPRPLIDDWYMFRKVTIVDSESGTDVLKAFQELNRQKGITTIFVTHDAFNARHCDRIIMLRDGQIVAMPWK